MLEHTSTDYQRMYQANYSHGFEADTKQLKKNGFDPVKWSNPLEVQLPDAPSMKIYCLYGHGKETERSYWYAKGEWIEDENRGDAVGKEAICEADDEECLRTPGDFPMTRDQWIDTEVTDKGATPEVRSGVKFSDGDGTIATVSLGAMCVKGWKGKTPWNPAGIEVITQGECERASRCRRRAVRVWRGVQRASLHAVSCAIRLQASIQICTSPEPS